MGELAPRRLPTILFLGLAPIGGWFIIRPLLEPVSLPALFTSFGLSIFAFLSTIYLVPALGPAFIKANLKGRDLLKTSDAPIPESLGLVCASVYIMTLLLFIPVAFSETFSKSPGFTREGIVVTEFPLHQLSVYLSAILSLLIATLLGFLDDVFDIRWRHKLPIPIIASIPLLMVYFAEGGNTNVVVPLPLRWLFGPLIHLGPLYYLYMSLLSTFATNSINILAGINGSEVSQAIIIAVSLILNDLLYLPWSMGFRLPIHLLGNDTEIEFGGVWRAGMAYGSKIMVERHLLSLYFMLPLVAVCSGFMYHNWFPARAFPGDTLCYFTGMAFAVVGIQGHFSKTLLLFFLPQIFNFLLSCPQLFGLVPCPRHRVPRFDKDTWLLSPSTAKLERHSQLITIILRLFSALGFVRLTTDATGRITETTNLTILNCILVRLGPMGEKQLVKTLMATQVAGSVLAFVIRYGLARMVFDGDRR
ncbi:UDP-N-acetylglucosamine-dolichyl [Cylindrobasidium torrendii FP15055 ss-10]|uniref:UDP-N-acetylglucosamine--dolichyl-phosphate N-acetylglucosaminephosphotransferase n=1 Tax=Cylindrobasidium torrendii FP15055 ss-10 TaxID=1314674 RepID=A0A0D7BNG8_9AGAR|nr:UDP-N-acetylglucosamine-dolichyl [Cylindrobasidium torrendii FP15055 ss-10]